jgi:hypothetical protein
MRSGVVATSVVAACQFSHGEYPGDSGGRPDTPPDAGMCAKVSKECINDTLRECVMVGSAAVDTQCGWGCLMSDPPRCAQVVPSGSGGTTMNGVLVGDVTGTGLSDVTLTDGFSLNSDNGQIGTLAQPNALHTGNAGTEMGIDFEFRGPISVFRFKQLTIAGTVTLIGSRPVAIVSDGPVLIMGTLDARGICSSNIAGPGGFNGGGVAGQDGSAPANTSGAGSGAPDATTGGGGGGHGGHGGDGDSAAGGGPYGDPAILALLGGAGGGAGNGGVNFGRGGGGGGAVQIISNVRISVSSGGINAGGCGGKAGTGGNDSGGGGGAGGAILLEAPLVNGGGTLAANGGGGGGGGGGAATPGKAGTLDAVPALGGSGNTPADEYGGSGAAGSMAAGSGGSGNNPGGGGGGIGRIRLNTRGGSGDMLTGTISPTQSTGSATTQ